ncbi:hypothetical protein HZ994_07030 [Akkermansiaceae bacterium]|nr:hypothetical protein HZ994_07030 [Akkermansiaceae bacterium]
MSSREPDPGTTRGYGQQLQEIVQQLTASQTRIHAFIASLMPGSRARYRPGSNFLA